MTSDFRLTFAWRAPSIQFGPATVAAFGGGATARKPMASRDTKDDRQDETKGIDKERMKAVELAFGQIEKQFGKGAIMRLGDGEALEDIPHMSKDMAKRMLDEPEGGIAVLKPKRKYTRREEPDA